MVTIKKEKFENKKFINAMEMFCTSTKFDIPTVVKSVALRKQYNSLLEDYKTEKQIIIDKYKTQSNGQEIIPPDNYKNFLQDMIELGNIEVDLINEPIVIKNLPPNILSADDIIALLGIIKINGIEDVDTDKKS